MGAEQPTPAPPGVVEALVASCESRGVVRFDDGLEIGQKVRILSGPFAGDNLFVWRVWTTVGAFECSSEIMAVWK